MTWNFTGTYFENCSCDTICPCTHSGFTAPADQDRCTALLAFHIDEGVVDGVDVSNLGFAMFLDTPPVMADGNWRVGLFLDASASQEQADKIGAVLSGGLGGPPAMLAPLFGEMLGVESATFDYADEGARHRVRIGNAVDLEVEDFAAPGGSGVPVSVSNVPHPANTTLTVAKATRSRAAAFGLELAGEGKSAFSAPFTWSA